MKKLMTTTLLAALLASGSAHAGKGSPVTEEERAEHLKRMQAHLQLSDEQVAEIREIRAQGGKRDEIRAVLTDEQRATWDSHREQRREKWRKDNSE